MKLRRRNGKSCARSASSWRMLWLLGSPRPPKLRPSKLFSMVPSQMFEPLVVGCDPPTATASPSLYRALCTACNGNGYIIISNSWPSNTTADPADYFPRFSSRLSKMFARHLSEAEKDHLRRLNWKPTVEGIKRCRKKHNQIPTTLRSYSNRDHFHFDRRIPCWRATRWKSLT